jgi:hypothetical protein
VHGDLALRYPSNPKETTMTTEEGGSKLLDDITKFAKQFKLTGLETSRNASRVS